MFTKYECMSGKELRNELIKRGYQPYKGGKRWNQKFLMRQRLEEDDKKKIGLPVENAQTPQVRYDERIGSNDE